jgi:hypothetical protein
MSLYVGMDYTPIEEYDTTLDQRWAALSHTAGRVAPEDMLEMQAIFGLVSILPSDYYSPPLCRWKHRLTADNVGSKQGKMRMRHQSVTYLLVRTLARFAVAAAGLFVAGTLIAGAIAFQPGALLVLALVGILGLILLHEEWCRWRNRDHT